MRTSSYEIDEEVYFIENNRSIPARILAFEDQLDERRPIWILVKGSKKQRKVDPLDLKSIELSPQEISGQLVSHE